MERRLLLVIALLAIAAGVALGVSSCFGDDENTSQNVAPEVTTVTVTEDTGGVAPDGDTGGVTPEVPTPPAPDDSGGVAP